MSISESSKAIWDTHRASVGHDVGSDCKPGEHPKDCKKKKKRRKRPYSVFPVLYPGKMGTPRTFQAGSANDSLQTGGATGSSESLDGGGVDGVDAPGKPLVADKGSSIDCRPSRVRVMHEMKKSLGLLEFFSTHAWGGSPGSMNPSPSWGGYSIPGIGMTKIRSNGPKVGGPGFKPDDDEGAGGRYHFRHSPGIGFRTELAWRIWKAALDIIDKDKTLTKPMILMQAIQKAGLNRGQIDPAELRLLEMGIEWYLVTMGAVSAKRGDGGSGGGQTGDGHLAGKGAP